VNACRKSQAQQHSSDGLQCHARVESIQLAFIVNRPAQNPVLRSRARKRRAPGPHALQPYPPGSRRVRGY